MISLRLAMILMILESGFEYSRMSKSLFSKSNKFNVPSSFAKMSNLSRVTSIAEVDFVPFTFGLFMIELFGE